MSFSWQLLVWAGLSIPVLTTSHQVHAQSNWRIDQQFSCRSDNRELGFVERAYRAISNAVPHTDLFYPSCSRFIRTEMEGKSIPGLISGLGRFISAHVPDPEIFHTIVIIDGQERIYDPPYQRHALMHVQTYSAYPQPYLECSEGRDIYWARKDHRSFDSSWRLRPRVGSFD